MIEVHQSQERDLETKTKQNKATGKKKMTQLKLFKNNSNQIQSHR